MPELGPKWALILDSWLQELETEDNLAIAEEKKKRNVNK